MIFSMKIEDMASKLTHLLAGLQIGHSSMGSLATSYLVQVVCEIRRMKIDLLMKVQGQGFPTFQPQALVTLEMMFFLLALKRQGTVVLLSIIQGTSLLKILNPRSILV